MSGSIETSSPSRFVPSPLLEPYKDLGNSENRLELMMEVSPKILDGCVR